MNTANLQLQGLLQAIAALNNLLVSKGVITRQDIAVTLEVAEEAVLADVPNELSHANREAITFPIRLLQLANNSSPHAGADSFTEVVRRVGQTKDFEA